MLGMYDMPALQGANDRFWAAIRARLGKGPSALTRDMDFWDIWESPDLLFAQTCGMPYRTRLQGQVSLIGTPDYRLPDCPPGYYCSVFVAHRDAPEQALSAFEGRRFAYNEAVSQSGWAAPMTHLRARHINMGERVQTGAHSASARAVADGTADLAALDLLTWELLKSHDPVSTFLRVIARTDPTPGLPYITAPTQDAHVLADAVRAAITDLDADDRAALHLHDLIAIPHQTYLSIPTPPAP